MLKYDFKNKIYDFSFVEKSLITFKQDPTTSGKMILSSVAEPELHLLVGAGAVTRCGSGSDNGIKHG
jgi:hypothetical protein